MNHPPLPPIEPSLDPELIRSDAARLAESPASRILHHGDLDVLIFRRDEARSLFHELTRQREITFRHSNQGSGNARDETAEDAWYRQLVLWDRAKGVIAGAYRLGFTADVLPHHGTAGMYLSHMFDFVPDFFARDARAVELTRSFVSAAYQKDRVALPLLWRGLGTIVCQHDIQRLFGSVTLSPEFSSDSRRLMTSWLKRHRTHPAGSLATARQPFPADHPDIPGDGFSIDALKAAILDRSGAPKPIPPLLRHYLSLGAVFHSFHLEPSFGNAVYCLLEVEVATMPPSHAQRFLGKS